MSRRRGRDSDSSQESRPNIEVYIRQDLENRNEDVPIIVERAPQSRSRSRRIDIESGQYRSRVPSPKPAYVYASDIEFDYAEDKHRNRARPKAHIRRARTRRRYGTAEEAPHVYGISPRRKSSRGKSRSEDQDSDDVYDDYYGGRDEKLDETDVSADEAAGQIYEGYPPAVDDPLFGRTRIDSEARRRRSKHRTKMESYTNPYERILEIADAKDQEPLDSPPFPGALKKGLWPRAALSSRSASAKTLYTQLPTSDALCLKMRLILTRRGERYRGCPFPYVRGSIDDHAFARTLRDEYRSLKAAQIGWLQKLVSYRRILFVYFLQWHAYPKRGFPSGEWRISDRRPVTKIDDAAAKSAFMYKLQTLARESQRTLNGKRPRRVWTDRLDDLIEPGAVVDIEVLETFDTAKIYIGLGLAILASLGVALAYGFATSDRDFATGFSIASWMVTAAGFFLAVVAAGSWLGLEKPGALLEAPGELAKGVLADRGQDMGFDKTKFR